MEASQAAQGTGDAATATDAQGAEGQASFADTQAQLQQFMAEQREFMTAQQQAQQEFVQQNQPAPEPEADPFADLFDPNGEDPAYMDPQRFAQTIEQAVAQRVEAGSKPALDAAKAAQDAVQEFRAQQEAQALVAEFPELNDPGIQQQTFQLCAQMIEAHNLPQDLMDQPWFWRQTYLAAKAAETANAESGAESQGAAHLEGGAGATPAGSRAGGHAWGESPSDVGAGVLPFR